MNTPSHPRAGPAGAASARTGSDPRPRHAARPLVAGVLAAAGLWACDRDKPAPPPAAPPPVVAAPPVVVPDPEPAAPPTTGWDAAAGLALVVPSDDGGAVLVAPGAPDSAGVDTTRGPAPALPAEVTLLAEHGAVGQVQATAVGGASDAGGAPGTCATSQRVRLGAASGANAIPTWTVGLAAAPGTTAPTALPLDSMEVLAARDSAALVVALTRLASALPAPRGVSRATRAALRGVPFRVRRARGFAPDGRTRAVVAALTRTMNQEAAPAADAVLLVAERPAAGGAWRTAYHERAAGREETLPAVNVLAAVRLEEGGPPRAALVLAREDDAGVRYALLERAEPGRWVSRWTSGRVGCER